MFKFITILLALVPVFLFLRAVFGRSTVMRKAMSELRAQIDYVVSVMLVVIALGVAYSVVTLTLTFWR